MGGSGMCAWLRFSAALIVALLCAAPMARAIERTKIPAMALADRDGRPRASESLQRSGQWLLVVVHPACAPCDAVLQAMAELPPDVAPSRVVVIIGSGTDRDVAAAIERHPALAGAEWLTASTADLTTALALTAASAVFGVRGNMIEWSVSGVLTETGDVRSIATAWITGATP